MNVIEAGCLAAVVLSFAAFSLKMGLFWTRIADAKRARSFDEDLRASRHRVVSILKPLAGVEDELRENLESFVGLLGPTYELLLGVASEDDPAAQVARAFVRAHPEIDAKLVVTDPSAAINPKIAQLLGLYRHAVGDVIVISDANVRVTPSYLVHLVGTLEREGCSLVTSIIAGTGERTVGAALENSILAMHATAGVVSAHALTGHAIAVGKSMAFRRDRLRAIGGLAAVGDVLAEDHALAQRMTRAGFRVGVSMAPVENINSTCSVRRSFERHTRWAKIRRAMAPGGYPFEPIVMPLIVSLFAFVLTRAELAAAAVVVAVLAQTIAAQVSLTMLRGRGLALRYAPIEVIRCLVLLACWSVGWTTRRVSWRGHPFRIGSGTVLTPCHAKEAVNHRGAMRRTQARHAALRT